MSCFHAENLLKVYTQKNSGYTKSRRKIRQQKIPKIDSKFLHIELLSREAWASKDTRFLTLSFGIDNTKSKKRNGIISALAAFVMAAAAFSVYAVAQSGKVPEGAIGQADAATNIQIEGAFAFDISQILLAIGFAATAIAVLFIIRTIHENRR